jgi:hypothetical protein
MNRSQFETVIGYFLFFGGVKVKAVSGTPTL